MNLPTVTNQLIACLPRTERAALLARCEQVDLVLDEVLCRPDAPLRHAWFPDTGVISRGVRITGHQTMEVSMSGNDGMLGETLALGVKSPPYRATVRGAGTAQRMPAADFIALLDDSRALERVVDEYVHRMKVAALLAVPCARFHSVEERLARWLLTADDRVPSARLHLTHDIVAGMLGVRRSAVSIAAAALQARGLIRYSRGRIRIVTRARLKVAACGCYHPLTRP